METNNFVSVSDTPTATKKNNGNDAHQMGYCIVLNRMTRKELFDGGKNSFFLSTRSQCFDINEVLFVSCVCACVSLTV